MKPTPTTPLSDIVIRQSKHNLALLIRASKWSMFGIVAYIVMVFCGGLTLEGWLLVTLCVVAAMAVGLAGYGYVAFKLAAVERGRSKLVRSLNCMERFSESCLYIALGATLYRTWLVQRSSALVILVCVVLLLIRDHWRTGRGVQETASDSSSPLGLGMQMLPPGPKS